MADTPSPVVDGERLDDAGPLTRKVLDYAGTVARLVSGSGPPADWTPLTELVAVDEFERVGTFLEVQTWDEYLEMMTRWASASGGFATTVKRIAEVSDLVFFEIEERHARGDEVHVVNSMTVFAFTDEGKIRRLDVYLQQPR